MSMGFEDELKVNQALEISNNDINDAITFLTKEPKISENVLDNESQNKFIPPSDQRIFKTFEINKGPKSTFGTNINCDELKETQDPESEFPYLFPIHHLSEVEDLFYRPNWFVPTSKEGVFTRLLESLIRITKAPDAETLLNDLPLERLNELLFRVFTKIAESEEAHNWNQEIQDDIKGQFLLVVELTVAMLYHFTPQEKPKLLDCLLLCLFMVLDPSCPFHIKNKAIPRKTKTKGILYGVEWSSDDASGFRYGLVVDIIEQFGDCGGFILLSQMFETRKLAPDDLANLLLPFAMCNGCLNPATVAPHLAAGLAQVKAYLVEIQADTSKCNPATFSKLVQVALGLGDHSMYAKKSLHLAHICLATILDLVKCPVFNLRIAGLKVIAFLIRHSQQSPMPGLREDQLQDWLLEKRVIMVALERNLDQRQYTDKVKIIIKFLSHRLSPEDIRSIWDLQKEQNPDATENLRRVLLAAAAGFTPEQLEFLISLVHQSWQTEAAASKKTLLPYFGQLARDTPHSQVLSKVLEVLINWIQDPDIPTALMEDTIREHGKLIAIQSPFDQNSCIHYLLDHIKQGKHVMPFLKILNNIIANFKSPEGKKTLEDYGMKLWISDDMLKKLLPKKQEEDVSPNDEETKGKTLEDHGMKLWIPDDMLKKLLPKKQEAELSPNDEETKRILEDLINHQKSPDLLIQSLANCASTVVDPRYSCTQVVEEHLTCLAHLLEKSETLLLYDQVCKLWESLMSHQELSTICFSWFKANFSVLDPEASALLFQHQLKGLDSRTLSEDGFKCFQEYFKKFNFNSDHNRLKEMKDFDKMWDILFHCENPQLLSTVREAIVSIFTPPDTCRKREKRFYYIHFGEVCKLKLQEILTQPDLEQQPMKEENKILGKDSGDFCILTQLNPKMDDISELTCVKICQLLQLVEKYLASLRNPFANFLKFPPHGGSFERAFHPTCFAPKKTVDNLEEVSSIVIPEDTISFSTRRWRRKRMKEEIEEEPPEVVLGELIVKEFPHIYPFLFKLTHPYNSSVRQEVYQILKQLPTDPARLKDVELALSGEENGQALLDLLSTGDPISLTYNLEILIRIFGNSAKSEHLTSLLIQTGAFKHLLQFLEDLELPHMCIMKVLTFIKLVFDTPGDWLDTFKVQLADFPPDILIEMIKIAWSRATGLPTSQLLPICVEENPSLSHPISQSVEEHNCYSATRFMDFVSSCLQLFPHYFEAITPYFNSALLDLLVNCAEVDVRHCMQLQLEALCKQSSQLRVSVCRILFSSHLPFWVSSTNTRRHNQRLIRQCKEYFDLLKEVLPLLQAEEFAKIQVNPCARLQEELDFLETFSLNSSEQELDIILLSARLPYVAVLAQAATAFAAVGDICIQLINLMLGNYLFPDDCQSTQRLNDDKARTIGFKFLRQLAEISPGNHEHLCNWLINKHHSASLSLDAYKFERDDQHDRRALCGYVGLKNAGATCYMNAVLQQLFLTPGVKDILLAVELEQKNSILHEVQNIFSHLQHSLSRYYVPEGFWNTMTMYGEEVNVREHQDAFEFFTHLLDLLDEALKQLDRPPISQRFRGLFLDCKVCLICHYRTEREEEFTGISVTSKGTLEESLSQFVMQQKLEGEDAYYCEECAQKRNAVKTICVKTLPETLVFHLKRFFYDIEAQRPSKFNNYFKFPRELDMSPYMAAGMSEEDPQLYHLRGIVVHSGQVSAGHYYSFIKEKMEPGGEWIKFNDTQVKKVAMTDDFLEVECFGGEFQVKNSYGVPETRLRYWNAYILFYECVKKAAPTHPGHTSSTSSCSMSVKEDDPPLPESGIKSPVQTAVQEENLQLARSQDICCKEYMYFLINTGRSAPTHPATTKLLGHFLFNSFFHSDSCSYELMETWERCVSSSLESASWFFEYLLDSGLPHIKALLLDCPNEKNQSTFRRMVKISLKAYINHGGKQEGKWYSLVEYLVGLVKHQLNQTSLPKPGHLFHLLQSIAKLSPDIKRLLFKLSLQEYSINLLLGIPIKGSGWKETLRLPEKCINEFKYLFSLIAILVSSCNLQCYWTTPGSPPPREQELVNTLNLKEMKRLSSHMFMTLLIWANLQLELSHISDMFLHLTYCNETYSQLLIGYLLKFLNDHGDHKETIRYFSDFLKDILSQEDPLQLARIEMAFNGVPNQPGVCSLLRSSCEKGKKIYRFWCEFCEQVESDIGEGCGLQDQPFWQPIHQQFTGKILEDAQSGSQSLVGLLRQKQAKKDLETIEPLL